MADDHSDAYVSPHDQPRSRETKTRGPVEFVYKQIYGEYPRAACWGIREMFIQCVLATDCVKEKRNFKACVKTPECAGEALGLSQCRVMSMSPRFRLRGNRWDNRTEDELKQMVKDEKVKQRERELGKQPDDTHDVYREFYESNPRNKAPYDPTPPPM
eukprot:TRINITY_DN29281_c0_g1_i1.p1 TRINITY_DN29281_c0_g1~~TRINITY_DN29281_c0_g1_i1.p1  ORF type:complete len:158 (+),score=18.72 TRINITY_DN29281_c0_g1_i1:70-543(+)